MDNPKEISVWKQVKFVILISFGVCGGIVMYTLVVSGVASWRAHQEKLRNETEEMARIEREIEGYERREVERKKEEVERKEASRVEAIWAAIIKQVKKDESNESFDQKVAKQLDYQLTRVSITIFANSASVRLKSALACSSALIARSSDKLVPTSPTSNATSTEPTAASTPRLRRANFWKR